MRRAPEREAPGLAMKRYDALVQRTIKSLPVAVCPVATAR